jgi:hypothetical protein
MKRSLGAVIGIALVVALFSNCGKNDVDAADSGLTSGTLWATRNVGAEKPWQYGDYFAWGETAAKDAHEWTNQLYIGNPQTAYNIGFDTTGIRPE